MRRIVAAAALAGMLAVGAVAQEPPADDAGKANPGGSPAATGGAVLEASKSPAGAPAFERQPAFGRGESGTAGKGDARRADGELPVTGFFVSAGLVLLALFGALTLLRKLGRNRGWTGSDAIQVLARKTLGPNQTLVLVEVGARILQIGLAKDGMVALGEVTDPEEVARLKGKCATGRADSSTATFQKSLQESAADLAGGTGAEDPPAAPALRDVKRELASIRTAVQGWASLARVRGRDDGGDPRTEA